MADAIDDPNLSASREAIHADNQFRLLREDMLGEIRDEIRKFTGAERGHHRRIVVDELRLAGVEMGIERKRIPLGIKLRCKAELPQLRKIDADKRTRYLSDNKHILRHGNMACLLLDGEPAAFPTIHRIESEISQTPATITVQLPNDSTLSYTLSKFKTAENIQLVQLDSAIFAYEPFLKRLQQMREIPLSDELLKWEDGSGLGVNPFGPQRLVEMLKSSAGKELQHLLRAKESVILDESQTDSLCASLSQRVSLVQGPPGKSMFDWHLLQPLTSSQAQGSHSLVHYSLK
jgi:hypothetical protein